MPYPVYSETFLRRTAAGTWGYVVPQGRRAVVKDITVMALAAPPSNTWVVVGGVYTSYFTFQVAGAIGRQQLMAVAYAGQQIEAMISTAGTHVTISGYLLRDDGTTAEDPADLTYEPLPLELPKYVTLQPSG